MNRRSFFKSLAVLATGAVIAPQIFIPKLEPVRWKGTMTWGFAGDVDQLITQVILQRNLEFLKGKLQHVEFVTDPLTGLSLMCTTYEDYRNKSLCKTVSIIQGCSGGTSRFINL